MKPRKNLVFVIFLFLVQVLLALLILDSRSKSVEPSLATPTVAKALVTPVSSPSPETANQAGTPHLVTVTPVPVEVMTVFEGALDVSYYPEDLLVWQKYYSQPPIVVFENHRCTPIAAVPAGSYGSVNHAPRPEFIVRYNPLGKMAFGNFGEVTLPEVQVHFYRRGWGYSDVSAPGTLWSCNRNSTIFSVAEIDLLYRNEIQPDGSSGVLYQQGITGPIFEPINYPECTLDMIETRESMANLVGDPAPHLEIFDIGSQWIGFRDLKSGDIDCILITTDDMQPDGLQFVGWSYNYYTRKWWYHEGWNATEVVVFAVGKTGHVEIREGSFVFVGDSPQYTAPPDREQR